MPKHLIQGCPYRKPCPAVLMVRATEDRCSPRNGIKEMRQPARWSGATEHPSSAAGAKSARRNWRSGGSYSVADPRIRNGAAASGAQADSAVWLAFRPADRSGFGLPSLAANRTRRPPSRWRLRCGPRDIDLLDLKTQALA